jgi:hypothetical protein
MKKQPNKTMFTNTNWKHFPTPINTVSVSIIEPTSPCSVSQSIVVPITAVASTQFGTISNVQFFINSASIASDNNSPFTASWSTGSSGTYYLNAVATDSFGFTAISDVVTISVVAVPLPSCPIISITNPVAGDYKKFTFTWSGNIYGSQLQWILVASNGYTVINSGTVGGPSSPTNLTNAAVVHGTGQQMWVTFGFGSCNPSWTKKYNL